MLTESNAIETTEVILPDTQILGMDLKNYVPFHDDKSAANKKYPIQLVVDADNGRIVGVKAVYDKSVSFIEAESSINKFYRDWHISRNEKPLMSLWRVTPEEIAIQLSLDSNGYVEVIFLPFKKVKDENP